MQYAIIGDVHSSKDDLEKVLADIKKQAPDAVLVSTGDLFECTISKRHMTDKKYERLNDVMLLPDGFVDLLTFPSVIGNQEERILFITDTEDTLLGLLAAMPERIELGAAEVIHGHQFEWGGNPWTMLTADVSKPLTFYGHSHCSGIRREGLEDEQVNFGEIYEIDDRQTLVNVGAVIHDREWVLYDSVSNIVTFMKVQ